MAPGQEDQTQPQEEKREDPRERERVLEKQRKQAELEEHKQYILSHPVTAAIDFHGVLKPEDKRHIPVENLELAQRLIEEAVDAFVLSYAIDRADDVRREVQESGLSTITGNAVIINQKKGPPYWRHFVDSENREPGYTSGGKDFYVANHGVKVLFEDRADIALAAERQGCIVYRIRSERDRHQNHPLAFDTFGEAARAFLQHLEKDRAKFVATGRYWDEAKHVRPAPKHKGEGKGKGKGKRRDRR